MTRVVALLHSSAPLAGVCPACERVMDESGCRIGDDLITPDLAKTHGIGRVVETFCTGEPIAPGVACPACGGRG